MYLFIDINFIWKKGENTCKRIYFELNSHQINLKKFEIKNKCIE